jgi:hypothetical protein
MKNFIELIDTYLSNYSTYKNGKVELECEQGELIFYKKKPNIITIHGIYIYPEFREQGLCRGILQYLIDTGSNSNSNANFKQFDSLCVQSVLSKILYEYLQRFRYKNKKFANKKIGFYYTL